MAPAITTKSNTNFPYTADDAGTDILVGPHRLCCFTPETDATAIAHFVSLLEARADEAFAIMAEYNDRLEWNHRESDAGRHGKNWPVFNRREKLINQLMKQSGIKDS